MYNCFIIKTLFQPSKNQLKTVLNFAECSLYSLMTQWPQYVRFRLLQSNALYDYATKVTKYQRCNFIIQITNSLSRSIQLASTYLLNVSRFQFPLVSCHVSRDTFCKSRCTFFKSRRETTVFDQFCFREGLKTRTQVGIQDGF